MDVPHAPWWETDLALHPMGAALELAPDAPWQPTPAPALSVETGPGAIRVRWRHEDRAASEVAVEVVGELLVVRAIADGQPISRAVPIPPDADLARRRDRWSHATLEVVIPRVQPTWWSRLRQWAARLLERLARWIAPNG